MRVTYSNIIKERLLMLVEYIVILERKSKKKELNSEEKQFFLDMLHTTIEETKILFK